MADAHRDDIEKLESLYAENPEGRIFAHLAEAYRKAGELEHAAEVLRYGLDRHPDYSSAHVVLGRVLVDQGRGVEAEQAFRRVLELDRHNLIALRSLGDLALQDGRADTALDYYSRLLDVEPSDEQVRSRVASLTAGDGELESAQGPQEPGPAEPQALEPATFEPETFEPETVESESFQPETFEPETYDSETFDSETYESETFEPETYDSETFEPGTDEAEGLGPETFEPESKDVGAPEREPHDAEALEPQPPEDEPAPAFQEPVWLMPEREPGPGEEGEGVEEQPGDEEDLPELPTVMPGVLTETIAQVYARQGLYERAAEVYRELLRSRPEDDELRERLGEMERLAEPAGPGEGTGPATEFEEAAGEVGDDVVVEGWDDRREPDVSAELGSVWLGGDWGEEGVEPEATPYAWAEAEPEPGPDPSPPIRSYLESLLSWTPGSESEEPEEPEVGADAGGAEVPGLPESDSPPEESAESRAGGEGPSASASDPVKGRLEDDDDDLETFRSWLESLKR